MPKIGVHGRRPQENGIFFEDLLRSVAGEIVVKIISPNPDKIQFMTKITTAIPKSILNGIEALNPNPSRDTKHLKSMGKFSCVTLHGKSKCKFFFCLQNMIT